MEELPFNDTQPALWYLKVIADGHTVVAAVQRILKVQLVSLCTLDSLKPMQQTMAFKPASVLKHGANAEHRLFPRFRAAYSHLTRK